MRKKVSIHYIQAVGLCFLLVAAPRVSSADEVPGPVSAVDSTPNMACVPIPRKQEPPPLNQWNDCVGTFTYGDGNVYSGRFRHGRRDGFGVLEIKYRGQSNFGMIG